MAKVALEKIRIAGLKEHYKIIVPRIHQLANLHIISQENSGEVVPEGERFFHRYDLARIAFALETLSPFESKKSKLDSILSGGKIVLDEKVARTPAVILVLKGQFIQWDEDGTQQIMDARGNWMAWGQDNF